MNPNHDEKGRFTSGSGGGSLRAKAARSFMMGEQLHEDIIQSRARELAGEGLFTPKELKSKSVATYDKVAKKFGYRKVVEGDRITYHAKAATFDQADKFEVFAENGKVYKNVGLDRNNQNAKAFVRQASRRVFRMSTFD